MRKETSAYDDANTVCVPLMRKADVAKYFQCSQRQVELMVVDGRLPKPFFLGDSSPRWKRKVIEDLIDEMHKAAQIADQPYSAK